MVLWLPTNNKTGMGTLELYYFDTCPYCIKVLNYINKTQIDVELKHTLLEPTYREELIQRGGKSQVPCLIHDGEVLYESDDIVQWLKDHQHELKTRDN